MHSPHSYACDYEVLTTPSRFREKDSTIDIGDEQGNTYFKKTWAEWMPTFSGRDNLK